MLKADNELMAVLDAIWQNAKVLAHIFLRCIRDQLLRHQGLEKSGFTPGKSTIDLHRESLWEILRLRGIQIRIIGLLARLYIGTESAVNFDNGLSSFFTISSRVKQGYVFALTLFSTCMDWILGKATVRSHCGAPLVDIKDTDLDSVKDVATLFESLETLVAALYAFSIKAKPLGLEISWTKTRI
ncbi:uncharacterized protein LOC125041318 [Penaeus chinensis]|uniref:uncharacterized protein LOC125041318 n=1 Tax=Penaeus chinensis TaxID=139456 RepID=UPI001FB8328D|nr:uncharacterized protein LOC125041318 [Penaeus chinensis]